MDPISLMLGQALLDHHQAAVRANPPGTYIVKSAYTISYSALCARANVHPGVLPVIGRYLLPIAEWSRDCSYPALNSLAVNAKTGIPGDAYDEAGGFLIGHWDAEVERCIRFTGYPAVFP